MLKSFVADLHVHTLLSPCAAIEMTPHNIVLHAVKKGIHMIAVTDHNAGDNVIAAQRAAKGSGISIFPGMEVETREEIHVLTIFDDLDAYRQWEAIIGLAMNGKKNNETRFGVQLVVDERDELVKIKEEMLLAPITMSVEETVLAASSLGGLCIASHVDKPSYSVISQLGFIPESLSFAAVEIMNMKQREEFAKKNPSINRYPYIASSDAHDMAQFMKGPKTIFIIEHPTLKEVRQALRKENGRSWLVKY